MSDSNAPSTLRPETEADLAFVKELYRSTRDDLLQAGLPKPMLDSLMDMQFRAMQMTYRNQYPDADYTIVEADGAAIGHLIVHRNAEAIRLVYIALLPPLRGQGLGGKLVRALQNEAAQAGRPLALSVSTQSAGAQRLYDALGFSVVKNDGAYLEMVWPESKIQAFIET